MLRRTQLAFIRHHSLLFGLPTRELGHPPVTRTTLGTALLASMTMTYLPLAHVFRTPSSCTRQLTSPPSPPRYVKSQFTRAFLSDVIGWHMLNTCHQSQLCEYQMALIPPQLFQASTRVTSTLLIETRVVAGTRNTCQSIPLWTTTIGTRTLTQLPTPRYRQPSLQGSTPRQPLHSIEIKGLQDICPRGPRDRRKVPPQSRRGLLYGQIGIVELLQAGIGVLVGEIMRSCRD